MKHVVIHAETCRCHLCDPQRFIRLRPILIAAVLTAVPSYGLLWAAWTMLPR